MYSKCNALFLLFALALGMVLQVVVGRLNEGTDMAKIIGTVAVLMIVGLALLRRYQRALFLCLTSRRQFAWFGMAMLVFLLYMGLTGIQIYQSWPFLMLSTSFMVTTIFAHPLLWPIPLWVIGSMTVTQIDAYAYKAETTSHGMNADHTAMALPFAIQLNDFEIERDENGISQYHSTLTLTWPDGKETCRTVGVNHPARVGNWHIYQAGYDKEQGTYNIVQLVHDPLYLPKTILLWLSLLGLAWWIGHTCHKHRKEARS